MIEDLEKLRDQALAELKAAQGADEVQTIKTRYLRRKGELAGLTKNLGALPDAERRAAGEEP